MSQRHQCSFHGKSAEGLLGPVEGASHTRLAAPRDEKASEPNPTATQPLSLSQRNALHSHLGQNARGDWHLYEEYSNGRFIQGTMVSAGMLEGAVRRSFAEFGGPYEMQSVGTQIITGGESAEMFKVGPSDSVRREVAKTMWSSSRLSGFCIGFGLLLSCSANGLSARVEAFCGQIEAQLRARQVAAGNALGVEPLSYRDIAFCLRVREFAADEAAAATQAAAVHVDAIAGGALSGRDVRRDLVALADLLERARQFPLID